MVERLLQYETDAPNSQPRSFQSVQNLLFAQQKLKDEPGSVSDLRLVNVTAEGQAPVLLYSDRSGGIRDVLLDNFDLNLSAGPLTPLYGGFGKPA